MDYPPEAFSNFAKFNERIIRFIGIWIFLAVLGGAALIFLLFSPLGKLFDLRKVDPAKARRIMVGLVLAAALLRFGAVILRLARHSKF